MKILYAQYSRKGQLKIQEMAFVLVAIFILFVVALLFYFSISYSSLKTGADDLRRQEVLETVRKMSGTAEFSWEVEDCQSCVDMDKAIMLKDRKTYEGFWKNVAFLQIVNVYPEAENRECSKGNYPDCSTLTLVDKRENYQAYGTYVSLCHFDSSEQYYKCNLGKIIMGFETVQ